MIEGELYQLTKTGDVDITVDEHFDIIRRKTAHLFGGCAQIGGMLGATTPEQQAALWEYGFNLGIAFQVVDDLLDYTADERALGKPIGERPARRQGHAADHLPARAGRRGPRHRRRHRPRSRRDPRAVDRAEAACWPTRSRSPRRAARPSTTPSVALQHLAAFPASPEKDALLALPEYVLSRDR